MPARRGGGKKKNGGADSGGDEFSGRNSKKDLNDVDLTAMFDRLDELHADIQTYGAGKKVDIKGVYDDMAAETGRARKLLIKRYQKHLADKRFDKWFENLEAPEKASYIDIDEALGDYRETALGQAAKARAEAAKPVEGEAAQQ